MGPRRWTFFSSLPVLRTGLIHEGDSPAGLRGFGLSEIPAPVFGPGDILVEMKACGLCGTDVAKLSHPQTSAGVRLGHEFAGSSGRWSRSGWVCSRDRVTAAHHVPCGSCWSCRHGNESMCRQFKETNVEPCGFAELIRIPRLNAEQVTFGLPDAMTYEEASFTEPLACAVRAVERSRCCPATGSPWWGRRMGLLIAQTLLRAGRGHRADISEERLAPGSHSRHRGDRQPRAGRRRRRAGRSQRRMVWTAPCSPS